MSVRQSWIYLEEGQDHSLISFSKLCCAFTDVFSLSSITWIISLERLSAVALSRCVLTFRFRSEISQSLWLNSSLHWCWYFRMTLKLITSHQCSPRGKDFVRTNWNKPPIVLHYGLNSEALHISRYPLRFHRLTSLIPTSRNKPEFIWDADYKAFE